MKKKGIEQNDGLVQVGLQNSNNNEVTIIVTPRDMIEKLMEQGKFQEAIAELKKLHDIVGQSHPLSPYYQYKTVPYRNKMVLQHEPLDQEIAKRLPLTFKGKFSINEKEFEEGESMEELLKRKQLTQETIKIDMKFLETWIGEQKMEDEVTLEQEAAKNGDWVIVPEKLPPPLRVKLAFRGEQEHTIVEYLEIRLIKMSKKENKIVISNEQQENCPYFLSLVIDLRDEQEQKQTFKGKINFLVRKGFEGLIKPEKTILEFLKYSKISGALDIFDIERQKSIFLSKDFSLDEEEDVESIDKKITFLNELAEIEAFFQVKFRLPLEISSADFANIDILKSIIKKEPIETTFKETSLILGDKKSAWSFYQNTIDAKGVLITADEREAKVIQLFGASIENIHTKWTLDNAKIADSEKLKGKIKYMDQGETVKVRFVPGTRNKLIYEYSLQ